MLGGGGENGRVDSSKSSLKGTGQGEGDCWERISPPFTPMEEPLPANQGGISKPDKWEVEQRSKLGWDPEVRGPQTLSWPFPPLLRPGHKDLTSPNPKLEVKEVQ